MSLGDLAYDQTYMNDAGRYDSTPHWFTAVAFATSAPSNPVGGDIYWNESTSTLYEYSSLSSSWTSVSGGGGGGSSSLVVATATANYAITSAIDVLIVDADAGSFTVTLPTAVGATKEYQIISKGTSSTNVVTLATQSSQLVDGASTTTLGAQASPAPYVSVGLVSDNTNWWIL